LKLLNNQINQDITKKLIVNAVKQLRITGPALPVRAEIYDSPVALEAKQADFAVCSVLLLAAQHSMDVISLRQLLDNHKIDNQTVEQLIETYEKFKDDFAERLSQQGNSHNLPKWTSVSIEVQQLLASNGLQYKINLQSFDHKAGQHQTIQEMFCNQEELQSLINKLKDVDRHCERISK